MHRIRAFLVVGTIGVGLSGCNTANELMGPAVVASGRVQHKSQTVGNFSEVSVSDAIQADITIGQPARVEVEAAGSLVPLVTARVDGDRLIVELNQRAVVNGTIKVHIVTPTLDRLQASGASHVTVDDVASSAFELTLSGASVATLNGHFGAARFNTDGASQLKLKGEADDIDLSASGASVVDATNLTAKTATVDSSGASTIDLGSTDQLNPTASAASTIHYLGSPNVTNPDASGASTIAHG